MDLLCKHMKTNPGCHVAVYCGDADTLTLIQQALDLYQVRDRFLGAMEFLTGEAKKQITELTEKPKEESTYEHP